MLDILKDLGHSLLILDGEEIGSKGAKNIAYNFPNLLEELKLSGKKQVLVLGIETHICVYQTILALLDNGFDVTVIKDSCGSRQEKEYLSALDCIRNNGAQIKTTEMVLFELLKSAKHPKFKEIQQLIK